MTQVDEVMNDMISHISTVGRAVLCPGPFEKNISKKFLQLNVNDQYSALKGIEWLLMEYEIHPRTLIDKIYWSRLRLANNKRFLHNLFTHVN